MRKMKTFSDPIIQAIAKAIDDSIETMENIYKDKIACRILSSPPFECNNRKVKSSPKKECKPLSFPITYHILVKIGKKEHLERLIEYGEVYMNTTKFYRDHDNPEIGDPYEGALYIKDGRVADFRDNLYHEKLFCMWNLNNMFPLYDDIIHSTHYDSDTGYTHIALDLRKLSGFTPGEDPYMVVIKDVRQFNQRFKEACKKQRVEFVNARIVEYYDEYAIKPHIRLSPFWKRLRYKKQQEIRFLVKRNDRNPLVLKLGSLKDIAEIHNVNEHCLHVIGNLKKNCA